MKTISESLVVLISVFSLQARSQTILKSLDCENSQLRVSVEVVQEPGDRAAAVSWKVESKKNNKSEEFMGYLFNPSRDLNSFSSTDLGSEIFIVNSHASLQLGEGPAAALLCR